MHFVERFSLRSAMYCLAFLLLQGAPIRAQRPPATALEKGQDLARQGRWSEAEVQFRLYQRSDPNSDAAVVLLAESLEHLNQPVPAMFELEKYLNVHPNAVEPLRLYAVLVDTEQHNRERALGMMERCAQLAPRDALVWRALGELYLEAGKAADAVRSLQRSIQFTTVHSSDGPLFAALGYAFSQNGQQDQARAAFRRALELNRRAARPNAEIDRYYAQFLYDQGEYRESIAAAGRALAITPHSVDSLMVRANAFDRLREFPQAQADAEAAARLDPAHREAFLLLVRLAREQGQPQRALQYAQSIQKLTDAQAQARSRADRIGEDLHQAEQQMNQQHYAEAIPALQEITRLQPHLHEAWFNLGICYAQTAQWDLARQALLEYVQKQPYSADGQAALGLLDLQQNQLVEAIARLTQALQLDPGYEEARTGLASARLKSSQPQEALLLLHKPEDRTDPGAQLIYARALSAVARRAEALAEVRKILARDPGNAEALQLQQELQLKGSTPPQ